MSATDYEATARPRKTLGAEPGGVRRLVVAMLFITVVINYVDRSSIAIAAPGIADEWHLSSVQMGLIFSAFAWGYSPPADPRLLPCRPDWAAPALPLRDF